MKLDSQKELQPVSYYSDSSICILSNSLKKAGVHCFSLHWHERMEMIFVEQGGLIINDGNRSYEVKGGELAVFAPGIPHSATSGEKGATYHALMFDVNNFYNQSVASKNFLIPLHEQQVLFDAVVNHPDVIETVSKLIKLHKNPDDCSSLQEIGFVYQLFGLLFKNCLSVRQSVIHDSGRFKEVLEFVNNSFTETITTHSLCEKFGYDETYFCRRFKAITGLTPMVYIRILRLEKAKKLIKEGGMEINDVSSACGFTEQGYFTRCFKKHFGLTPSEYATKHKK